MTVLVTVLVLVLILLTAEYYLYHLVFCHPAGKRPVIDDIPRSRLYDKYRGTMEEVIEDMKGMPIENAHIVSQDGYRLCGKLFLIRRGAPTVIFFHGYHGTYAWDGYGFFKLCKDKGLNILMVDERAHGESESSVITFGIKERYDCKLWIDYVLKRFGEDADIVLAGVSMGAATVMMASELGLPENVRAIVADCGYSSPDAIVKETIRKMKVPIAPVYLMIRQGARLFGHFDLEEASPENAVRKLQIPILFIHGEFDSVVPLPMGEALYESCAGPKERAVIEGADHANSAMVDYGAYEKAVTEFLGRHLKI